MLFNRSQYQIGAIIKSIVRDAARHQTDINADCRHTYMIVPLADAVWTLNSAVRAALDDAKVIYLRTSMPSAVIVSV